MRRPAALPAAAVLLVAARPAIAWDPATTHAGLTERAAAASKLHAALARRFGRPLGLLEPLALHAEMRPAARRIDLEERLRALDPAGGFRPDERGIATAVGWLAAGSVLAKTPPERGRHHFFDPTRGRGLCSQGAAAEWAQLLRGALDGGSLRALATGTAFDLTGRAAVDWVAAPDNDLGWPAVHDGLERAATAASPEEREGALAEALLAMGGVLAVLEDAGEPAHVRNDYRVAFLGGRGGTFDRMPAFERFTAERYGRAVPDAAPPVARASVRAFFTDADGQGLADRTNRRFFSPGTLPEDAVVDRDSSTLDVVKQARATLRYPHPAIPRLELREIGRRRYLRVQGRRALGYLRVPGRVRFFLDESVYLDSAKALLPDIAGYAAGLIDHLTRGEVAIEAGGGSVDVSPPAGARRGRLRVLVDDESGRRTEVRAVDLDAATAGPVTSVAVPPGARRVTAVFRGEDAAGPLVASAEIRWPN